MIEGDERGMVTSVTMVRPNKSNTEVAMIARISMFAAAALAAVLMVVSLWAWQQGPQIAFTADRPDVVLWAVRTAAIAAGALAQALVLVFVVGAVYRTRLLDVTLRVLTAAVFTVALVSAIALGLAGR